MFTKLSKTTKARSNKGSAIELTLGITFLVPVMLLFIDIGFLVLGVTYNDSLCRNAARAASAADPQDADQRIASVLNKANNHGPFKNLRLQAGFPTNNGVGNNPFGPVGGSITVRTNLDVDLPAPVPFANIKQVTLSAQQTFPYTFVRRNAGPVPN